MLGSLGVAELLIILAIIVVLFGVNKLPRLGKGLGEGIKNFKDSIKGPSTEEKSSNHDNGGSVDPH
jgi:sec-independent protein translocase protein TatA